VNTTTRHPDVLVVGAGPVGLAEPTEIAAAVAFLLSPDASYITGTAMDVAGGWI
jgi:3-oxoacyl-[acyl-carrier protein] reductase